MRKLIVPILFLFGTTTASAYEPLLKEGRVWKQTSWEQPGEPGYMTETYTISGDTVVEGEHFLKLSVVFADLTDTLRASAIEIWQEEGEKIYRWNRYIKKKELVYDFSISTGDSLGKWELYPDRMTTSVVTMIDTISVGGIQRRRIHIEEHTEGYDTNTTIGYWIEGIGCSLGLIDAMKWSVPGRRTLPTAVFDGDECIFTADDFYAPSWTGDQTDVQSYHVGHPASSPLFDLQGRRLPSGQALPSRHGVFIRDGKKILR